MLYDNKQLSQLKIIEDELLTKYQSRFNNLSKLELLLEVSLTSKVYLKVKIISNNLEYEHFKQVIGEPSNIINKNKGMVYSLKLIAEKVISEGLLDYIKQDKKGE